MKKFLSLVLALVMTMSLVTVSAGAKGFTDGSEIQYKEAVDVMSAAKVVDGYADGDFRPDATLTRGAAAKIICNLILGPTTAAELHADTAPFKDVPVDHTFAGYIAFCAKEGIISGYADGAFRPAATLTSYAFMKMLLGALGYDAEVEQYVGGNWSINVAKRALNIGLDDGLNGDFNGIKPVTREEACLYALNTLTADMVEYDSRTNINVGGAEVIIAGSEAKVMENKSKTDGKMFDKDGEMQFAEMYFDNLSVTKGTDDFARPANVWKNKAEKIGTYSDEADLTYTAKVEVGDIYKDLDLGSTVDKKDVTVYVNGVEDKDQAVAIKKGDDDNEFGANGVLTEVFYNDDDDTVVITLVDTYVGTIAKSVAAKGGKDAYVVVSSLESKDTPFSSSEEFETNEEFEDDAYVLYTYSESAEEIKSVVAAEKVEGTVTRAENSETNDTDKKSLTIDGTKYNASAQVAGENLSDVSVKNDYTIYLDAYGYMIYVEEIEEIGDYALFLQAEDGGSFRAKRAQLVLADGTVKIVETAKDYSEDSKDEIDERSIVTYRVDDEGTYTLREVETTKDNANDDNFKLTADKARITVDNEGNYVNANSASVIVVCDPIDSIYNPTELGEADWSSYTGIKNAPSVSSASGKVDVRYYAKNNGMLTIMFVMPNKDADVESGYNDTVFIAKGSAGNLIHDEDGDYFEYDAIVNGEIKEIKVSAEEYNKNAVSGLYSGFSTDKYGIITELDAFDDYDDDNHKGAQVYQKVEGIAKTSKEYTVTLNTADEGNELTFTVDDDAEIYYVNEDHEISKSSYKGIAVDDNDLVYAVVKDYMVQTLVIQEVDDEKPERPSDDNDDLSVRFVKVDKINKKVVLDERDKPEDGRAWTARKKAAINTAVKTALMDAGYEAVADMTYAPDQIIAVNTKAGNTQQYTFAVVWG